MMKAGKKRNWIRIAVLILLFVGLAAALDADCILVLGAGLKADGTPNHMLKDRLEKGIELYNAGSAPKLLLSGDNGQVEYDEVNAMKKYVLDAGIPRSIRPGVWASRVKT